MVFGGYGDRGAGVLVRGEAQRSEAEAREAECSERGVVGVNEENQILPAGATSLRDAVKRFEASLILTALQRSDGQVTKAAALLGSTHQALAYVIASRHPELLIHRSLVRKRRRGV